MAAHWNPCQRPTLLAPQWQRVGASGYQQMFMSFMASCAARNFWPNPALSFLIITRHPSQWIPCQQHLVQCCNIYMFHAHTHTPQTSPHACVHHTWVTHTHTPHYTLVTAIASITKYSETQETWIILTKHPVICNGSRWGGGGQQLLPCDTHTIAT